MAKTIKAELQDLQDQRERGIRELGLTAVDMYGRKQIDIAVLRDNASELAVIDQRIRDLEARQRLATP